MALTSVSTRSPPLLGWLSRSSRRGGLGVQTVALLGALAMSAPARAQVETPAPGAVDTNRSPQSAVSEETSPPVTPPALPVTKSLLTPAVAAPTSPISRLPAEMSVQARAGALELFAKNPARGSPQLVLRLPLPGDIFDTLCIGGFLFVARGSAKVVVLDVRDPMQTRQVATFPDVGAVHSLWGGTGSLMLGRSDGTAALFDVSDPKHPRYQSVVAVGTTGTRGPTPVMPLADLEPLRPHAVAEQDQHRMAIALRPFLFFANRSVSPTSGGAMLDFSYQYAKVGGLWWGVEISPLVFNSYNSTSLPFVNSRVFFGYSGRRFAVAAAMGSGFTSDQAWLQFGALLRVGRLNGVHSTLRLIWSALLPIPYPVSGEFNLEGPISQRLGLRYNFTGDTALSGFHTTLGLQFFVGGDHRWRTIVLIPGMGFSYMRTNASTSRPSSFPDVHHPGVIFSFTVEPRW